MDYKPKNSIFNDMGMKAREALAPDTTSDAKPFDDRAEEAQQEAADQIAEERVERGED